MHNEFAASARDHDRSNDEMERTDQHLFVQSQPTRSQMHNFDKVARGRCYDHQAYDPDGSGETDEEAQCSSSEAFLSIQT